MTHPQSNNVRDNQMQQLSKRVSLFTESVIRRMTRVATDHNAINLSQGFPDFAPPPALLDALEQAARHGPHQYAVTWGAANFRQALADKHAHFSGMRVDPNENIVVTCGSTEAMMAAMLTVCNPGDKVIVFSPFYENYGADAILSGADPIYVPLVPPEFGFDRDALRRAFEMRPKALILCNPSNPTGKVFTRDELDYIAGLANEFDVFVITDEVYEHIVYAPYQHIHFASLPGMFERTITCSSLSKTYSITGWRLGYIIAPGQIIHHARKVHDFLTVGAPAPLQEAAVTALAFPDSYYRELAAVYTEKRAIFLSALQEAGLRHTTPMGAYYVMVDISDFNVVDDVFFCEWLAREGGVAAVPGSSFFREPINHLIRFHFAKKAETLLEAGKRLSRVRELWAKRKPI
jgi:aspartate/methionine/tyrosine aminotransferase